MDSSPSTPAGIRGWERAGSLPVTGGKLLITDPMFYAPGYADEESDLYIVLEWPYPAAELWISSVSMKQYTFVRAAMLARSREDCDKAEKVEAGAITVDSATVMVADLARLERCWRRGGPENESVLGYATTNREEIDRKARAVALLTQHGFSLRRDDMAGSGNYRFDKPLTEEEILRADELLKAAQIEEFVNVIQPHSEVLLHEQLGGGLVATLDDGEAPYLYAFGSGWGDGIYWWGALKRRDVLVGYVCEFLSDEDVRGE